jgi:D-proline reductase (dithiol) PrdB
VALLSSAGLYLAAGQEPFDAEGERANPGWGDPSWRPIPRSARQGDLRMMHLHVNDADVMADHEVALPLRRLDELVAAGVVGAAADTHYSVMGYQEDGLEVWRTRTAPEIVEVLRDERVDGVVLAPV